ncbi:chaperone modulator CbpM [Mariniflexile sp.]|uniref:chaperone modulator CbpM n=1 Tax=Mariniflexile sp. TaxID=1979402 RepID=UPI004047ED10
MNTESYIPIKTICTHYKVETTFLESLNEYGLIEVTTIEKLPCIHQNHIKSLESMIRMHADLHLNFEGIDTVLNLLEKIEHLQNELRSVKNRLGIYEDGF